MKKPRERLLYVDLLRCVAVTLMVQGHAFDALLEPSARGGWFDAHTFWHGFTAPLFLFSSGLAFAIASFPKWSRHVVPGATFARRIRRYGSIIALGYALQLPSLSLAYLGGGLSPDEAARVMGVDALQVIGITLFAMQVSALVIRRPPIFAAFWALVGLTILVISPLVWSADTAVSGVSWLDAYFVSGTHSAFPVTPWSFYLCMGLVVGFLGKHWSDRRVLRRRMVQIGWAGLALMLIARAADISVQNNEGYFAEWDTNPLILISKASAIILFLVGLYYFSARLSSRIRGGSAMRLFGIVGSETLFIYILHLQILYGSPVAGGLNRIWSTGLPLGQTILVFLVVFIASCFLAIVWHQVKRERPAIQWALVTAALA